LYALYATKEIPEAAILSTSGMLTHAKESKATEFIVATETGIIHQLQKQNPKEIFPSARRYGLQIYENDYT